jgi:uncharacterized protein
MAMKHTVSATAGIDRGRLALITGASSGIGAAFARAYAARGADVMLVARRVERLQALAQTLHADHGVQCYVVPLDLAQPDAPEQVAAVLAAQARKPDILVNNAGYSLARRFVAEPWPAQRAFVQVLVTTAIGLCHVVLPGMIAGRFGRIINVASIAAFSPGASGHTLYPAAKSFVVKMSQSLSAEVKASGVHVSAICPGQTESEFVDANGTRGAIAGARMGAQSADDVVAIAIRGVDQGREVVVPGFGNKVAAAAMRLLPDALRAAIIRPIAAKFSLPD